MYCFIKSIHAYLALQVLQFTHAPLIIVVLLNLIKSIYKTKILITNTIKRKEEMKIMTWRSILPTCYKESNNNKGSSSSSSTTTNDEKPKKPRATAVSKEGSFQWISLSDISYPGSPLSVDDLSNNSLLGADIHIFTMTELRTVTHNFSLSNLIGEGGFGPVHKGFVDDKMRPGLKAQPVAVKVLDLEGLQGHREWLAEVIFLGQLKHPHLVKLIGYCYEDEHRLLVYEYMPRGSLENHLFRKYGASLAWSARMKIALGAAKGLAFLHEAEKPVIYRDFKASNILLDSDYTSKLSDFGLAKDGPEGDDTHVSTRVMGTHGYAAPEYVMTGHLTAKSDVYSFGVVLLELLTGKRSMDKARPNREQNLVEWLRPQLNDHRKLDRIMDPRLEGLYSTKGAQKAAALAYQCLSHQPKPRPTMSTVVKALELLQDFDDIPSEPFVFVVPTHDRKEAEEQKEEQKKENRQRMRSQRSPTVYSDSSLNKNTVTSSLNSPMHHLAKRG
ncbi:hypothetical protein Syun_031401 [Stephania yunnanensis]|uniref:non-specific serine/threonine protein kinase n=1 Tax=Stephania yunnanensis TaxID=152371 RepID=A0AAP0DYF1_9MAGN